MSIDLAAPEASRPADDVVVTARIERLPNSPWHFKAGAIVGIATFFNAFEVSAIVAAAPVLAPQWNVTDREIDVLIASGLVGQLVGALLFAWVADRFGRVPALAWSTGVYAGMSFVCAFAWSHDSLLVFRLVQGIGLGGEAPVAVVYLAELVSARRRGRFVLVCQMALPVGLLAPSLVGPVVVPRFGWQYMFILGALAMLLALFLTRLLPESPRWLAARGRTLDADAALSLIERASRTAIERPLPSYAAASGNDPRASGNDILGPGFWRRTAVVGVIAFATQLVHFGLVVWLPTVYRSIFNLSVDLSRRYGLMTLAIGLVGAGLSALAIDRLGRRPWFSLALAGAAASLLALALMGVDSFERVLFCATLAYVFIGAVTIGVYLYACELYPTRMRALGAGMAAAWLLIAALIGPSWVEAMLANGLPWVFAVFGIVAAIAAVTTGLFAVESAGRTLEEVSP